MAESNVDPDSWLPALRKGNLGDLGRGMAKLGICRWQSEEEEARRQEELAEARHELVKQAVDAFFPH